eukprot:gene7414-9114_t
MDTEIKKVCLIVTKEFKAPIEKVWRAWSESEELSKWWGPDAFTCNLVKVDFREGGLTHLGMTSPQFGTHYSLVEYKKIVPNQRIEYIHNLADKDGNIVNPVNVGMKNDFPTNQLNIIEFESVNEGTLVKITEFDWIEGTQIMEYSKIGLNQCLNKIEKLCL